MLLPEADSAPLARLTRCTVSGWGVTWLNSYSLSPVLRSVDVSIFPNCWYYYYFRISKNMICAGSLLGGKDSCQVRSDGSGDSCSGHALNLKHGTFV